MLKRSNRLSRDLFSSFEGGRFLHSPHFSLRFKALEGKSARIGVSVSKKVAKQAVMRNRTRRRVYSALAPLIPALTPGVYLISVKSGAEKLGGATLEGEVAELMKKSYNR